MTYDREIKYMTKQLEKARLNLICAHSHDNTPQEQIKNLVEKIKIHETILDALDIASRVRHGKWLQCFDDWRKQIEGDKCSACGFEHYGSSINHYHYCHNCGAKMDGKDDKI